MVIDELGFSSIPPKSSRTVNGTTVCSLDYYQVSVPDLYSKQAPQVDELCAIARKPRGSVGDLIALHFNGGNKEKERMIRVHACWKFELRQVSAYER